MNSLEAIAHGWKWKGIEPAEIIDQNVFGNVIIRTMAGEFWLICPEELDAKLIASAETQLNEIRSSSEFVLDWEMNNLAQQARDAFGDPGQDRCYCLKIPAVLGGTYDVTNIGTISIAELLACSGDLAKQIDDVPDGGKVRLIVK